MGIEAQTTGAAVAVECNIQGLCALNIAEKMLVQLQMFLRWPRVGLTNLLFGYVISGRVPVDK